MFIKPLHDRIIVQRLEESAQGTGAIHIPDSAYGDVCQAITELAVEQNALSPPRPFVP